MPFAAHGAGVSDPVVEGASLPFDFSGLRRLSLEQAYGPVHPRQPGHIDDQMDVVGHGYDQPRIPEVVVAHFLGGPYQARPRMRFGQLIEVTVLAADRQEYRVAVLCPGGPEMSEFLAWREMHEPMLELPSSLGITFIP